MGISNSLEYTLILEQNNWIPNPLEYTLIVAEHNIQISIQVLILCILVAFNAHSDKTKPSKIVSIDLIGKQKYFEGVGFDKNICIHSLSNWTLYFVLHVWYFMELPNFPSNISFRYYHCRTCILRKLFPQCYGNLCK